ncbi:branched-chain amino acid aminotransferase/4-amino-4-deoxychorismate lyase [Moorella thermoacetica Y72]|uniref:Branched-chain-amino-acid aminotransferase n=2 Tax=Neomoorella thermoacetica TaxID=1525 RepID=A0A1J5K011_NEOTH|nr:aminotransferase class IV [Moorella thermoacetica]OIQ09089.1 branched-chain-amino-acid aminotransferase [Moorella thermoacetica]GAF25332.1 branched-chain amino acid aminotransferase/4-amino-4-deoxychorismate lyase [Moorella thermoacetica Y72]
MPAAVVYFNGSLRPLTETAINPADPGFLYGAGLFETIRIEDGRALFLTEHLDRLTSSSRRLGWPVPDSSGLPAAIQATIAANQVTTGRGRLNFFQGSQGYNLMFTAENGLPYTPEDYREGYRAAIVTICRNQHSPLAGLKTMNYLENLLAMAEAREKGAREALLLNLDGYLAEGSRSNLFIIWEDTLFTPDLASGPLPGLARSRVLKLAAALGLTVKEEPLKPEVLLAAGEAFLTNSLMEILPLTWVDGQPIGNGRPGPVTTLLRSRYQDEKAALRG